MVAAIKKVLVSFAHNIITEWSLLSPDSPAPSRSFEPLGNVDLKKLPSLQTAFQVAVTSARKKGNVHVLSAHNKSSGFLQIS